jgi:hypothetical protein
MQKTDDFANRVFDALGSHHDRSSNGTGMVEAKNLAAELGEDSRRVALAHRELVVKGLAIPDASGRLTGYAGLSQRGVAEWKGAAGTGPAHDHSRCVTGPKISVLTASVNLKGDGSCRNGAHRQPFCRATFWANMIEARLTTWRKCFSRWVG